MRTERASELNGLRAVVIGAGFGGLSAAAHLRRRGVQVTVVERAAHVGGKAAYDVRDGFVFDAGPTLLTMPEVIREAFAAVGGEDLLPRIDPVDPQCRYLFSATDDQDRELVVWRDRAATARAIAKFSRQDADAWGPFLDRCAEIWRLAGEPYLEAPFEGFAAFSSRVLRRGSKAVQLGMSLGTLEELAEQTFESSEMRRLVGRFATYAGASPREASAAFAMIVHLEATCGAYYPQGGMNALAGALGRALARAGVAVRTDAEVAEIALSEDSNAATGVILASGERLDADVVVCNVEPAVALRDLLPAVVANREGVADLEGAPRSLSGLVFSFGAEGSPRHGAHHTVLFAREYAEEFTAIFSRGEIADEPTLYVSIPSLADPARAPEGHHVLFAMLNAPARAQYFRPDVVAALRERVVQRIDAALWPGFGERIRAESVRTPADIARTGSSQGAIYGAAPHGRFAPFERPRNRARSVRGLYFAGGATHPGGGVPLVMISGRFVAELAAADASEKRSTGLFSRFARTLSRAPSPRSGSTS